MGQMGGTIGTGSRLAQMPDDLPRGDDKRGDECPHPMPDGLMLACLRFARGHGLRRVLPLQNLPASLFIGADDQTIVLKEAQGIEIEGTDGVRFGLEVRIVAVEPIDTTMGLEVCLFQNAPDAGATPAPGAMLRKSSHQIIEAPAGGGAVVRSRFTSCHRHHSQTR
jgi:hypothetical protein